MKTKTKTKTKMKTVYRCHYKYFDNSRTVDDDSPGANLANFRDGFWLNNKMERDFSKLSPDIWIPPSQIVMIEVIRNVPDSA
jgi:hypothetical protein